MLDWIKDLKEGETAFDNPDETKPCTFDADGNRIINKGAYMGNKYRRLIWDRPGACIATRSDVMSSQDTIHPCDNRVLSIRELMTLMTIPNTFRWTDHDDKLTVENSDEYLKENEGNIRRCIGEAVPTQIGNDIASKIRTMLDFESFITKKDPKMDSEKNFYIQAFKLGGETPIIDSFETINTLPSELDHVSIKLASIADSLTYIPQLCAYYSAADSIDIDVVGLNKEDKIKMESLFKLIKIGFNVSINFQPSVSVYKHYDVVVENGTCRTIPQRKVNKKSSFENELQLSFFD